MINRTVQSASRKDAEAVAREIESQRDKGVLITERCIMGNLFQNLILDYRSNAQDSIWAERIVRKHLGPYFGPMTPPKVTTSSIRAFIEKARGAANGTINRRLPYSRDRSTSQEKRHRRASRRYRISRCWQKLHPGKDSSNIPSTSYCGTHYQTR